MKYTISYKHMATGYGWQQATDTLKDFEGFINENRGNHLVHITVWDETMHRFIYWQDGLAYRADMLSNVLRDMRTNTKEVKR